MALRKEGKKQDPFVEDPNPNSDIFSNTTAHLTVVIKSWKQVYEILEKENSLHSDESSREEDESTTNKLRQVANLELHKVITRPKLLPYTYMIHWSLDHVDILTRTIYSHQKTIVGSFQPEYIQVIYKLTCNPKYTYNASFIMKFLE
jgi:hypothetical protein